MVTVDQVPNDDLRALLGFSFYGFPTEFRHEFSIDVHLLSNSIGDDYPQVGRIGGAIDDRSYRLFANRAFRYFQAPVYTCV